MPFKPQLQFNAQMAFMVFYKNAWRTNIDLLTPIEVCRTFLISRKFINACFAGSQKRKY